MDRIAGVCGDVGHYCARKAYRRRIEAAFHVTTPCLVVVRVISATPSRTHAFLHLLLNLVEVPQSHAVWRVSELALRQPDVDTEDIEDKGVTKKI